MNSLPKVYTCENSHAIENWQLVIAGFENETQKKLKK